MSAKENAKRLYRRFREREPTRARRVTITLPKSLTVMGRILAVEYATTHGDKSVAYKHKFAPGSRPLFCADPRSGKIFLVGGRYRVTSRGIVDIDSRGRQED